jgi:hypothetical protein
MSAQEGHPPHPSVDHRDARAHRLERVLRSYGVLTRARLYELSGADCWASGPAFDAVLAQAVRAGRVRALGGVLFEAAPEGADGPQPDPQGAPAARGG